MKIKFLKEYKFLRGFENDVKFTTTQIFKDAIIDTVEDEVPDEDVQWLIDNGFAERLEAMANDKAFCLSVENCVSVVDDGSVDCFVPSTNVKFPKGHQEQRNKFTDFMEAVRVVSQDEGFMRKNGGGFGWPVIEYTTNNPGVDDIAGRQHAGEFYFDTREHALNSAMNHTREWQTIMNYDWSRE